MSALPPPAKGSKLPAEEIDRRLLTIVYAVGNVKRAAEELGISHQALYAFKRCHAARYYAMYEREAPKVEAQFAADVEHVASRAAEVAGLAINQTEDALREGRRADQLASAAKSLALVATSFNKDITGPIRGRVTAVEVRRVDTSELFGAIQRSFPGALIVEGTATEETPDEPGPQLNGSDEES